MARRLELQTLLESLIPNGTVYFQPPAEISMTYPCIVYKRDRAASEHADNLTYRYTKRYQVTVIDRDPDSDIPDRVKELPLCRHAAFFVAHSLNHDVFDLYF